MLLRSSVNRSLATGLLLAGLAACGQNYSDSHATQALAERQLTPEEPAASSAPPAATGRKTGDMGEVTMDVPKGWESVPPSSSMRVAEYRIPAAHGAPTGATLAVFSGNMGSVEDNVRRWLGQFDGDGSRREARTQSGFAVTLVQANGSYNPGMGGSGPQSDYRMLGAIVDIGGGFYYLKLTGPRIEVAPLENDFEAMVLSLRRS